MGGSLLDRFYAWLPALEPRSHKRQRLFDAPFPAHWRALLEREVPFWTRWPRALRDEAEPLIQVVIIDVTEAFFAKQLECQ